ncbi:uncharacterized protein PV09_09011 [Verruconis gallopava]|uniref:Uncharacterized protein n=1 Tax=Verruconis gallopava TaxID=253628 RepID=A0A0D2AK56_9PEZI|nr:uncharacterized protein PV09_09011 [Verruconis gallopava]KIV99353.1 hypothetical protein PV09_09011 [Verruconis gallopava]
MQGHELLLALELSRPVSAGSEWPIQFPFPPPQQVNISHSKFPQRESSAFSRLSNGVELAQVPTCGQFQQISDEDAKFSRLTHPEVEKQTTPGQVQHSLSANLTMRDTEKIVISKDNQHGQFAKSSPDQVIEKEPYKSQEFDPSGLDVAYEPFSDAISKVLKNHQTSCSKCSSKGDRKQHGPDARSRGKEDPTQTTLHKSQMESVIGVIPHGDLCKQMKEIESTISDPPGVQRVATVPNDLFNHVLLGSTTAEPSQLKKRVEKDANFAEDHADVESSCSPTSRTVQVFQELTNTGTKHLGDEPKDVGSKNTVEGKKLRKKRLQPKGVLGKSQLRQPTVTEVLGVLGDVLIGNMNAEFEKIAMKHVKDVQVYHSDILLLREENATMRTKLEVSNREKHRLAAAEMERTSKLKSFVDKVKKLEDLGNTLNNDIQQERATRRQLCEEVKALALDSATLSENLKQALGHSSDAIDTISHVRTKIMNELRDSEKCCRQLEVEKSNLIEQLEIKKNQLEELTIDRNRLKFALENGSPVQMSLEELISGNHGTLMKKLSGMRNDLTGQGESSLCTRFLAMSENVQMLHMQNSISPESVDGIRKSLAQIKSELLAAIQDALTNANKSANADLFNEKILNLIDEHKRNIQTEFMERQKLQTELIDLRMDNVAVTERLKVQELRVRELMEQLNCSQQTESKLREHNLQLLQQLQLHVQKDTIPSYHSHDEHFQGRSKVLLDEELEKALRSEVKDLKTILMSKEDEITALSRELEESKREDSLKLEKLQNDLQRNMESILKDQKAQYENRIRDLHNKLMKSVEALQELREETDSKKKSHYSGTRSSQTHQSNNNMSVLQSEHESCMPALKDEYEAILLQLREKHDAEIAELQAKSSEELHSELRKKIENYGKTHVKEMDLEDKNGDADEIRNLLVFKPKQSEKETEIIKRRLEEVIGDVEDIEFLFRKGNKENQRPLCTSEQSALCLKLKRTIAKLQKLQQVYKSEQQHENQTEIEEEPSPQIMRSEEGELLNSSRALESEMSKTQFSSIVWEPQVGPDVRRKDSQAHIDVKGNFNHDNVDATQSTSAEISSTDLLKRDEEPRSKLEFLRKERQAETSPYVVSSADTSPCLVMSDTQFFSSKSPNTLSIKGKVNMKVPNDGTTWTPMSQGTPTIPTCASEGSSRADTPPNADSLAQSTSNSQDNSGKRRKFALQDDPGVKKRSRVEKNNMSKSTKQISHQAGTVSFEQHENVRQPGNEREESTGVETNHGENAGRYPCDNLAKYQQFAPSRNCRSAANSATNKESNLCVKVNKSQKNTDNVKDKMSNNYLRRSRRLNV